MSKLRNYKSPEGAEIGRKLAQWCDDAEPKARLRMPELPPRCNSCAFREGPHLANQSPATQMDALERVMRMLSAVTPKRKRVYVLIGNEPVESSVERIQHVIDWGGEPHVQWYMKLNALEKRPHVRFDWTEDALRATARWANRRIWRYATLAEYRRSAKTSRDDRFDARQGLFV